MVIGDTMYLVTPFPNYVYAFDQPETGTPVGGCPRDRKDT